jgi:probable HAF family extracellular repeat protein
MKCATRYIVVLLFGWFSLAAIADPRFFMGLGDLPGQAFHSRAHDISADGTTVVGESESVNGREAFRWTQSTGMVGLGDLPGGVFFSTAKAVSADGSIVVGFSDAWGSLGGAFRWVLTDPDSGAGTMTDLGDLPGGDLYSDAHGVSASGDVIVGFGHSANGREAFRWTDPQQGGSGMVGLGFLPGGLESEAWDASADGTVVVGANFVPNLAFRWTAATGMVSLGTLPGNDRSFATAVNPDGTFIVGLTAAEAFRWMLTDPGSGEGIMIGLGDLPGGDFWSGADDISADGSVVVGRSATGSFPYEEEAFIWDEVSQMRRLQDVLTSEFGLDLSGWTLRAATAISDDGRTIVGFGDDPNSVCEAWIAHLGPACPGDVDDDGDVDLTDLAGLLAAYGACEGDPNYNPNADFDSSGCVDLNDRAALLSNYGFGT